MEVKEKLKFKIAYCLCGQNIVVSSLMPYAETDKDSQRIFRDLAREGRNIEIVESLNTDLFDRCLKCFPEQLSIIQN